MASKVYESLSEDSCVNGFAHTKQEIILWLSGCDTAAKAILAESVVALLADEIKIKEGVY